MSALLETIEVLHSPQKAEADAAVIWMHGLGADGHDFEPLVPELRLPENSAVRFIFPHAPVRRVTVNMGMSMRSWYDIKAMTDVREIDERELGESCRAIEQLIEQQIKQHIPAHRIILAGFSQGGAVAMTTALRYPERLGGVVALSTYLPKPEWIDEGRSAANAGLAVFMAHGTQDEVVPIRLAEAARSKLSSLGYPLEWHQYPMPHSVCMPEVADIATWLKRRWA